MVGNIDHVFVYRELWRKLTSKPVSYHFALKSAGHLYIPVYTWTS